MKSSHFSSGRFLRQIVAPVFARTRTLTCSAHACVSVYVRVRARCYCLLSFTSQGEDGLLRVSTVVMVRGGGGVETEKKKIQL